MAVAQAEQAVADAKLVIERATLVSPVDGIVVAVNVIPGLAAPSGAAVTLRSSALEVTASVTESDLPLVVVGQEATVTITALATDVTGTVAQIDQVPASASTGVVSYGIVVTIAEAPKGAVPGMTAEIAVTTASAPNVLAVPAIALDTATDGTYTVQVLDASGQPTSVAVEVGLISSSLAEIKSGISEGTAVVTGTASDRTSSGTTTTRPASPASTAAGSRAAGSRDSGRDRARRRRDVAGPIPASSAVPADPRRPTPRPPEPGSAPTAPPSSSCAASPGSTRPAAWRSPPCAASTSTSTPGTSSPSSARPGSGKSTLMNIIGCLDRPTGGTYHLAGTSVETLDDDDLARVRGRAIGFVFQSFNLLPRTSALENVATPLLYQGVGRHERLERARAALERLGLGDRMDHEPSELSGGQQQRVAIARALVTRPVLILADEPTGNLDSASGVEVLRLLHELNAAGTTIVLITHDSDVAVAATRQVHVRDGLLVS